MPTVPDNEKIYDTAESLAPKRRKDGTFLPGSTANRSGRHRKFHEVEAALWSQEADKVCGVVEMLRCKALEERDVDAARLYLDRVLGKLTTRTQDRPAAAATPITAEEVRDGVLRLLGAEVASFTAARQERALTTDELGAFAALARIVIVAGKEERAAGECAVERMSDEELAQAAQALIGRP